MHRFLHERTAVDNIPPMKFNHAIHKAALACLLICLSWTAIAVAQKNADREEWISLFNGKDLNDWIIKIRGHEAGENFGDTFRVNNGMIQVRYDKYTTFDNQFGHLFYKQPFSHYRLRVEYRFVGDQAPGAPEWAIRNSGAMLHSQDPKTMPAGQDFPISIEFQFLGGLSNGMARTTGNMCSPGTNIVYGGKLETRHCINSTSVTFNGDQWVVAEAIVLGDKKVTHVINGKTVIEYSEPQIGGGAVSGHNPAVKQDGKRLTEGFIALQGESHPVDFRRVELLNLKGCMKPAASNYKRYYVEFDPAVCK
jgi:3-keto-disaccharide hydrolase